MLKYDVIEKVGRPQIGKRIKEYMGAEDSVIIQMIIKILNGKPDYQSLISKLKDILDKKTEEFVMKIWQSLVFENMKVDEGLYDN